MRPVASLPQRVSRVVLDLVLPPACALCGSGGTLLCEPCALALPRAHGQRCNRCWMPLSHGYACRHCIEAPPAFASLRSAYVMQDGARRLTHELKYEGMTSYAEPMAELMAQNADLDGVDLIAPVALHRRRERTRGYNQSAELGRRVAAAHRKPFDARAVRRVRDTAPLAKAMSRDERRAIVLGAFTADADRVEGRRILLIDDVCTTGATLDACACVLLEAGAAVVQCLVWARED